MIILSLNAGSSSLKFLVFDYGTQETLATGIVERVTISGAFIKYSVPGKENIKLEHDCPNHQVALQLILKFLTDSQHGVLKSINEIKAVGHRVLHGGEKVKKSVRITPDVIATFKELYPLGPLHNPANVTGIEAAMAVLPQVPHMAIMDTAWHQTMPEHAFMYALPREWYEKHSVRRYGFHGTSFLYVAKRAAVLLGKDPFKTNVVILHIGNGASANAVKNGCSYDTSMGLTPQEGLIMGTRAGDHDAAIDLFIMEKEGKTPQQMSDIINKKSGVLGITKEYADRRDIEIEAGKGNHLCQLAVDMESYRLKKYIGSYMAALGGIDAVVFTAGVGEMSDVIRAKALEGLESLGIKLDPVANDLSHTRNTETCISAADSKVKVFVIPTDEERVFLDDVVALLDGTYDEHTRFVYPFQKKGYVNKQRARDLEVELKKKPGLAKIIAHPV